MAETETRHVKENKTVDNIKYEVLKKGTKHPELVVVKGVAYIYLYAPENIGIQPKQSVKIDMGVRLTYPYAHTGRLFIVNSRQSIRLQKGGFQSKILLEIYNYGEEFVEIREGQALVKMTYEAAPKIPKLVNKKAKTRQSINQM